MRGSKVENKNVISIRSIFITLAVLAVCTCVGFGFTQLNFDSINTILVYITGVVLIAMWTQGRVYSMTGSVLAVIFFNFFFAKPYFSLVAEADYFATFAVMLLASFLVSSLTIQIKKKSEEAARNEERAKQEEIRSNLLRSISHDLRTPLTGISGNAALLLKHGNELSENTKKEIYSSIDDDSRWLINLVENLLSITRISDKLILEAQEGVVQEIVDEALQHVDAAIAKYTIVKNYSNEPVIAKMDSKLMMQVVTNIVNNAIKYTDEGSTIELSVTKEKDQAVIRIADNGVGISTEAKEKIFERFYSEGKLHGDSRRGLGLGLYLCKLIMEAHGGHILAIDNEPCGTVFECSLPATELGE